MPVAKSFLLASSLTAFAATAFAQVEPNPLPAPTAPAPVAPGARVLLHYASFDPLVAVPAVPPELAARADNELFVVQFRSEVCEEFRAGVLATGARIHHYLPEQSYLVRMTAAQRARVAELSFVRYVGAFHPAYKIAPDLRSELSAGVEIGTRRYDVMLVDRLRDEAALTEAIVARGGSVVTQSRGNVLLEAELTAQQVLDVAGESTVLWIQQWTTPEVDMDNARIQGGANYLQTATGMTGKGVRGHIMEGVYPNHTEFVANAYRVLPIGLFNTTGDTHGNATFGVIFARGAAAQARGLCPDGQGLFTNYSYVYNNNNRWTLVRDLVDPTLAHKAMFQTASWGYAQNIVYEARAAEMDRIIFDHDMPITQSQSNTGSQRSRPQAWAKNIISVGALSHYNNANPADDRWTSASYGPAPDQRYKPELCAFYDLTYTTYSSTGYGEFGGTSGATPIVAGHLGLAIEMFTDGLFGYPAAPSWNQRFDYRAHATTMKALLIATARQYDPAVNGGIERRKQGFGFPSLQDMYDLRNKTLVVDELDVLTQGASRNYWVFVKPGTTQFKSTMTYLDPEAAVPTSGAHRVNDLDLKVVSPSYQTYHGNNGLANLGLWSTTGGTRNSIDTVENVFVQNPASGLWQVEVSAPLIAIDQHLETPVVDADYALVSVGIGGGRDRSGVTNDLTSSGSGNLRLALGALPASYAAGFTIYSATTSRPLGTGNFLGLELDSLAIACLSMTPTAGSPFAFTPSTTVFPAVPYQFPAPIAVALTGLTLDCVTMFVNGSGAVIDASNVSRVTVQ